MGKNVEAADLGREEKTKSSAFNMLIVRCLLDMHMKMSIGSWISKAGAKERGVG